MKEYLNGNYKLASPLTVQQSETTTESSEQEFYRRALEKLGGSIAFVMKSKSLLWTGSEK